MYSLKTNIFLVDSDFSIGFGPETTKHLPTFLPNLPGCTYATPVFGRHEAKRLFARCPNKELRQTIGLHCCAARCGCFFSRHDAKRRRTGLNRQTEAAVSVLSLGFSCSGECQRPCFAEHDDRFVDKRSATGKGRAGAFRRGYGRD